MKTNFKIMVELIKHNASISAKLGEKVKLATVTSKGNAYTVASALAQTYTTEYWKMSIE